MADYQPGSGGSFVGEDIGAYKEIWDSNVPKVETIEKFLELMDGLDFLWTAHHCGNIDKVEEDILALYEACSEWGLSEDLPKKNKSTMMLQEVFKGKVNPGLFGNSDDHTAKAGCLKTGAGKGPIRNPSGLTAVFSSKLSRQSVYNSLKQKQCYATSGARILVIPKVEQDKAGLCVHLEIAGTAELDRVWVFKNGKQVTEEFLERGFCSEFIWEDDSFSAEDNCYIRISQMDGELAWINPVPFVKN